MALWEQIRNKHEQRKQNVATNNTNNAMLYNLLTNDKVKPQSSSLDSASLTDGIGNIANAAKTFGSMLGSSSNSSSASPIMSSLTGNAGSGSAIKDGIIGAVNGTGSSSGSAITDSLNNSFNTTATTNNSGGLFSKLKGGTTGGSSGGGGSVPWAAIAGVAKGAYNSISGKEDKDYSDTEESIIYPLQGAAMGSQFGPWGAAGGALYGLGYSFKDDLGMKDSNFLTQMLFPIGMGDGGGLKIGGKSILDLG